MSIRIKRGVPYIAVCVLLIAFCLLLMFAISADAVSSVPDNCEVCAQTYVNGFCSCENGYQPLAKNGDGIYEISNAGQLYSFARLVNEYNTEEDITFNAIITADITVNSKVTENGELISDTSELKEWVPILTNSIPSREKIAVNINGNGKIISGLYGIEGDMGLLGYPGKACSILRLGIVDSYFSSTYCGSFIGDDNGSTVTDCFSTAIIKGGMYSGGIIGQPSSDTVITNCFFGGKITHEGCSGTNAIACDCDKTEFAANNCYYLDSVGVSSAYARAITAEQVESGFLTYRLNNGVTDGTQVWYQTVGEGAPGFSGATVYASEPCASVLANTPVTSAQNHSYISQSGYDEVGHWSSVCENCGDIENKTEHQINTETDACSCGFVPLLKIVAADGDVSYIQNGNYLDIEDNFKVFLLKESVSFLAIYCGENCIFDLNGKRLGFYVNVYGDVMFTDSSTTDTGMIDANIYFYQHEGEKLIFEDVAFGRDSFVYSTNPNTVVFNGVTINAVDPFHSGSAADAFKIISAEFVNGISLGEQFTIASLLYDGGFVTDEAGNEITLTEGQREISGKAYIKTPLASVTVGNDTEYFFDINEAFDSVTSGESAEITLLRDYSPIENGSISVSSGNVNLDFAGKRLSNLTVWVMDGAALTVEDSSEGLGEYSQPGGITGLYVYGDLTINGGIFKTNIDLHGSLTVNGGSFKESLSIEFNSDAENPLATLKGGSYDNIRIRGKALVNVIAENYLPKLKDGKYITDLSVNSISNEFSVIAHTHSYALIYDDEFHYRGCECGKIENGETPQAHYGGEAKCEAAAMCQVCGVSYGEVLGHDYDNGTVNPKPTCTEPGVITYVCRNDQAHTYTEPVDPHGHDYENGICTLCEKKSLLSVLVDGRSEYYYDDISEFAEAISDIDYKTLDIVFASDFAVPTDSENPTANISITKGNVSIDLAGHNITDCLIMISNAALVFNDSSIDKNGSFGVSEDIPVIYMIDNADITVNGGAISGVVAGLVVDEEKVTNSFTVNGGKFEKLSIYDVYNVNINGGSFTDFSLNLDNAEIYSNSSISIKNASFKNVSVSGLENISLGDIFSDAECLTYAMAQGSSAIDFTAAEYNGSFTISHDDSHTDASSYKSDAYKHWQECVNGVISNAEAHTYKNGAVCDSCEAKAPFVLELNGKFQGYNSLSDALAAAQQLSFAKLILNCDIELLPPFENDGIEISNCDILIDLNGHKIYSYYGIYIYGSDVTITDSSKDGSGFITAYTLEVNNSRLTLKNIKLDGFNFFDISYSEVVFDGVRAAEIVMLTLDDYVPQFINAVFDKGIGINEESYDLAYIFGTECMSVTDADGKELVFNEGVTYYDKKLTVVHNEEHTLTDWVYYDDGKHAKYCVYCNLLSVVEECSGGEADCVFAPICDKCGNTYGEKPEHSYADGSCEICGNKANFTVINGEEEFYFEYAYDAFLKADSFDKATIILNTNYRAYGESDIEIAKADVIFDLNGFLFEVGEMNLYGGSITITDSSLYFGYFYTESTFDIYNGALIIENGEFGDLGIDLDPEDLGYVSSIIIKGGYFEYIDIDTDYEGDIFIDISGGTFDTLGFDIDDPISISVSGGEMYHIYLYDGGYLEDLINVRDCVKMLDENGRRIYFDSESNELYGYVKFVHAPTEDRESELNYSKFYHWYECECGVVSEKVRHTGGAATCESLAVCDICKKEYGDYLPHKYDENRKCTVCDAEASGIVKLVTDSQTEYFDTLAEAVDFAEHIGENATLTLLGDVIENMFEAYDVEYVLDLNGFTLKLNGFIVGDSRFVITDNSKAATGKLKVMDAAFIDDYGAFEIANGNFEELAIVFDSEHENSEFVISGGSIKDLIINGNGTVLFVGGEITGAIRFGLGSDITVGDIIRGCITLVDESGNPVVGIEDKSQYKGYLKALHTDTLETLVTDTEHITGCLCGKIVKTEAHVYDNDCDAGCNVCEFQRIPAEHVYDNDCDASCNVCNAQREANHIFGETEVTVEPTHTSSGEGARTCAICGAKETVIIPEKSGLPAIAIVAISAASTVAVMSGGFSLFWFVIRKKKLAIL